MRQKKVRLKKPKVTLKCVANTHTGPEERIIEFSHRRDGEGYLDMAGGLINLMRFEDGSFRVCVYRCERNPTIVQVGSGAKYHLPVDAECVGVAGILRSDDTVRLDYAKSMLRQLANVYDGDFLALVQTALAGRAP